jgi:hypothetical protein
MPYIKLEDRSRFEPSIKEVLSVISNGPENLYVKGEYFGYFTNRLVRRLLGTQDGVDTSFNSTYFNETKKKTIQATADSLSVLINRSDLINSAGELNYCISAVMWGFMGAANGVPPANYGMRAFLKGILEAIIQELKSPNTGNQGDVTQAFRRNLIIRGVLSDVIDEAYRRDTAAYENRKKTENGDIWLDGELVLQKGT